jgi:hypothetical protein
VGLECDTPGVPVQRRWCDRIERGGGSEGGDKLVEQHGGARLQPLSEDAPVDGPVAS